MIGILSKFHHTSIVKASIRKSKQLRALFQHYKYNSCFELKLQLQIIVFQNLLSLCIWIFNYHNPGVEYTAVHRINDTSMLGDLVILALCQTVSIPWAEVVNNGEKSIEYYDSHVQVCAPAIYQF